MGLRDPGDLLEQLSLLPGGPHLLAAAQVRPELYLVGGAVRDLLIGRTPLELDVVVQGDAVAVAQALAAEWGATLVSHPSFATARVTLTEGASIDLTSARREHYPHPGGLPMVEPASLTEDLQRRDFTLNAIAVSLAGPRRGELQAPPRALEDLAGGRLRVLHDASFRDDPTRLLRLARYAARLRFDPEEHTRALAARAVNSGALRTISGARAGAELRLALGETEACGALAELQRLGVLAALHPRLRYEPAVTREALGLLPPEGRPDLLLLSALSLALTLSVADPPAAELRAWLDRLEFPAGDRDLVVAAAVAAPRLVSELPRARRPSQLRAAVASAPLEAVALAGALGAGDGARRWLSELRHVRLQISGHDLLAAGVPEGPQIGHRLEAALALRLDGELAPGRSAELRAALRA